MGDKYCNLQDDAILGNWANTGFPSVFFLRMQLSLLSTVTLSLMANILSAIGGFKKPNAVYCLNNKTAELTLAFETCQLIECPLLAYLKPQSVAFAHLDQAASDRV